MVLFLSLISTGLHPLGEPRVELSRSNSILLHELRVIISSLNGSRDGVFNSPRKPKSICDFAYMYFYNYINVS